MTDRVIIHEVGPRDGLQNEPGVIATGEKIALIKALLDAGLQQIEVGSFVSPRWVPQMADTPQVLAALPTVMSVQYDVLVPNAKGWRGFEAAYRAHELPLGIAVFVSASEGFSRANLNCSVGEGLERAAPVVAAAQDLGVPVRGYVSCVTDCPFDGAIPPDDVVRAVKGLRALAPMPISLGDTIGKATPERITTMLTAVLQEVPAAELAGHFHDTSGRAIENVAASLDLGLRHFDSAVGGLGGCPYAPGAPGNLATEELVTTLHAQGIATGVDPTKLALAAEVAKRMRGHTDG